MRLTNTPRKDIVSNILLFLGFSSHGPVVLAHQSSPYFRPVIGLNNVSLKVISLKYYMYTIAIPTNNIDPIAMSFYRYNNPHLEGCSFYTVGHFSVSFYIELLFQEIEAEPYLREIWQKGP